MFAVGTNTTYNISYIPVTEVIFPLQVTLISAFVFPTFPPNGINVFFAVVIVMICGSHLLLVRKERRVVKLLKSS